MLDALLMNVRYAARMLLKYPLFSVSCALTLALGIGATTAMFSVVQAVLLTPPPYDEPNCLVAVFTRNLAPSADPKVLRGAAGAQESGLSIADLEDFRRQASAFEDFAILTGFAANLTGIGDPQLIRGASVSANFFSLLGVPPALGRDFALEEDALSGERAVILSYGLWLRRFGGDPSVIGRSLSLDQTPYAIVGVAPDGFLTPDGDAPELYRAVDPPVEPSQRGQRFWFTIGRMKTDDLAGARAELITIADRLERQYPTTNQGFTVTVTPLDELLPQQIRAGLIFLLAAVFLVLLIACANIANLLMARTAAREREVAVRLAVGAGRWQLIQQFFAEGLLLALVGGVLGLIVASWAIQILVAATPADVPRVGDSRINWLVLGFTSLLTLGTGASFGLLPALRPPRVDLSTSLRNSTRAGTLGVKTSRLGNGFVAAQIALAVVLLIGAGLTLRSFVELQAVDPGFRSEGVLTFQVSMSRSQFRGVEHSEALFAELSERIESAPGVESAGATLQLPISGLDVDLTQVGIEGRPLPPDQEPAVRLHVVTPGYFSALGVPLRQGRLLNDGDRREGLGVALINDTMARRLWPNENPIGKRISQRLLLTPGETPERTIVGVVGDVKHFGLEFSDEPQMYVPHRQSPWPAMNFVVRSPLGIDSLAGALKQAVWSVDATLPVENMRRMDDILSQATGQPRFRTLLAGVFGAAAILLAAIGIYGVVSYRVAQRRSEIALRIAFGAERRHILSLVVADGLRLALWGGALGVGAALVAAPSISSLLYGVSPTDPYTIGATVVLCVMVTLLASYFPARRASKVDPIIALHLE